MIDQIGAPRYNEDRFGIPLRSCPVRKRKGLRMPEVERYIQLALPSPRKLLTPGVITILALLVVGYAVVYYAEDFTVNYLSISGRGLLRGMVWQLITYSFVNLSTWSMLFDGLVLLFMGSAIEREWRTGRFLLTWAVVSAVCGVIWAFVCLVIGRQYPGIGSAAGSYGLIAIFGVLFRRQRFLAWFWTVEAQNIAIFLIVVGIVIGLRQPMAWIWVAGAGVGYIYVKLCMAARSRPQTGGEAAAARPRGFVDID